MIVTVLILQVTNATDIMSGNETYSLPNFVATSSSLILVSCLTTAWVCIKQWRSQAGVCALATRGRAPPVQVRMQIIGADSVVVDCESGAKQS